VVGTARQIYRGSCCHKRFLWRERALNVTVSGGSVTKGKERDPTWLGVRSIEKMIAASIDRPLRHNYLGGSAGQLNEIKPLRMGLSRTKQLKRTLRRIFGGLPTVGGEEGGGEGILRRVRKK